MSEKLSYQLAKQGREILRQADLENRDPTPEERGRVEKLIARAEAARRSEKSQGDADSFARSIGDPGPVTAGFTAGGPGSRFVNSPEFKRIADAGTRGQTWSTGAVNVGSFKAGTALESGQGAG